MKEFFGRLSAARDKIESTGFFRHGLMYVLIALMTAVQWLTVQLCCQSLSGCLRVSPVYFLTESSLLFALTALVALCTGRWWIGGLASSLFAFVFGVLDHYVIDLHGTPLNIRDVGNMGTAGEVLSGYRLEIGSTVLTQGALLAVCLVCVYLLRRIGLGQKRWQRGRVIGRGVSLAVCAAVIFFGFFAPNPIKPATTRSWDWAPPLKTYGVLSCLLENTLCADEVVIMPEGYSHEEARRIAAEYEKPEDNEAAATPDVIFILNETYFDVSAITDLHTDVDPFAAYGERDDLIRGYAASPVVGGGTNCSEYEFLTGCSLHLSPGITPFQSLDMQGADSVVSRLEALGYTTISANSEHRENYYRHTGYPGLGFDRIYTDLDFTGQEYYEERCYETDESLYRNLIEWYEDMGDGPRFCYLLTIQNHGGYELCDPEDDTVHVLDDYGRYNDQMNEYLTSLEMSADALSGLIEYFEKGDRPVVVCMVGDHTTCFAPKIISEEYTDEEKDLLLRSSPYVVWSNCDFDESALPETVSLHALGSCVLAGAGIELSPYDSYVAEMCRTAPVFLSGGDWYDADGNRHEFTSAAELPGVLRDYVYMLYNNLEGAEHRQEEFFCP